MPDDSLLTRQTLLLRLRDPEDQRSWEEFVEIYTPLVFRYCQKRGVGSEDAADISQEVMRSVAGAMGRFEYNPAKGKFKAWFFTAIRHEVGRYFKKRDRRPLSVTESQLLALSEQEPSQEEMDLWERDYQRRLLAWAMEKVRPEFGERVWKAFVLTAVQCQAPDRVAEEIGMKKGAIAVAKFRVIRRLREVVESVDAEDWESSVIGKKMTIREISGDLTPRLM